MEISTRILSATALLVQKQLIPTSAPPMQLTHRFLTLGMYNVGNLSPNTTYLHSIAVYIVIFLKSPDLIEIQDDDSPMNSRTVSVNDSDSTCRCNI